MKRRPALLQYVSPHVLRTRTFCTKEGRRLGANFGKMGLKPCLNPTGISTAKGTQFPLPLTNAPWPPRLTPPPFLTPHPTPRLLPPSLTDRQVPRIEVHLVAHFQEVPQVLLSQKQVDRDPTPAGGLHEVTEKLHVGEYVHHHSHHLGEGESSALPRTLPSPGQGLDPRKRAPD